MHVYSSLLPPSEHDAVAAEEIFMRKSIQTFLDLLQTQQYDVIASHHFRTLHTFFKLKFVFPDPSILVELANALARYVFEHAPMIELQVKALDALVLVIKKARKSSGTLDGPEDLQLRWTTALDVWDATFYASPGPVLPISRATLSKYKAALIKYLSKARKSYPADASLWTYIAPGLVDTEKEISLKAAATLSLLWSPAVDATPLLTDWVRVWARVNTLLEWDLHWLRLFARVAKHQQARGTFDAATWAPHFPFLFAKIQHCLALPSDMGPSPPRGTWPRALKGLHGDKHALYYAAKLVVYTLSPASEPLALQLLHLLEPFFHPSSAGTAANAIADLVYYLSAFLSLRTGQDQARGRALATTPLVNALVHLAFLGVYAKSTTVSSKASFTLRNVLCLSRATAPAIVEKLLRGLDPAAVSQTHQAPSAIAALTTCGPALLRGDLVWAEALPAILHLTLPGVDPNDDTKTSRTLQLYSTWLMYLPLSNDLDKPPPARTPLADALREQLNTALFAPVVRSTDVDAMLWRHGEAIEAWVLQLLDRLFVLFRQQEQPTTAKASHEDKFQIGAHLQQVIHLLFAQLSPPLYARAVRRVADFVATTFVPTAGKLLAGVIAGCTPPAPALALPLLLVPACDRVLSQAALSEGELCWQLRVVDGSVRLAAGPSLLPHAARLQAVVAKASAHSSPRVVKLACKILRHVLNRLTHTYQLDSGRGLPPRVAAAAAQAGTAQFLGTSLSWGDLEPQWHEPTAAELMVAADWLRTFVIDGLAGLEATLPLTEWRTKLRHALHALRGAKAVMVDAVAPTAVGAPPGLAQAQRRLEAVLAEHPVALAQLVGLRRTVATAILGIVGVWAAATDAAASKCLRTALRVLTLLLHPRDAAHVAHVRLYAKWRKLAGTDTATKGLRQGQITTATTVPLLPRRLMQERIAVLLFEHLDDRSYATSRLAHATPALFAEQTLAPALLDAIEALARHPLAKTRAAAQAALDKVLARYPAWHQAQLPQWGALLAAADTPQHEVTGVLHLLSTGRSVRVAWKDAAIATALVRALCQCAAGPVRTAEDELKTGARVLKAVLQLLSSGRDVPGDLPPVAPTLALEVALAGHWRFQLLHLASVIPWLRSGRPVPAGVWPLVLRRVTSDVPQVAAFARRLLSRALKAQTGGLPADVAAALVAPATLAALTRDLLLDHASALRSADGQSADASPGRWALGVPELQALVEHERVARPLRTFGPRAPDHVSPRHVLLVERMAASAGDALAAAWQPLLNDLAACASDDRRAALATLGEVLVGLAPVAGTALYEAVLPTLSVPYAHDWHDVLLLALERMAAPTAETLAAFVVAQAEAAAQAEANTDATGLVRWLVLAQPVAVHLVHGAAPEMAAALSRRLLAVATGAMAHPYAFVREQVAALLYIFTDAGLPLPVAALDADAAMDVADDAVLAMRKTVLAWLAVFVHRGDTPQFDVLAPLFPVAFATQAFPDADVARSARILVEALAAKLRLLAATPAQAALLQWLGNALEAPQWRTRAAGLRFLTAFTFHHALLAPAVETLLVARLGDDVRDVQEMAQLSLRGFLRTVDDAHVGRLAATFLAAAQAARRHRVKRDKQLKRCRLLLRLGGEDTDVAAVEAQLAALEAAPADAAATVAACGGLGAVVLAYPYSVPAFVPAALAELARHVHVASVADGAKAVLLEFRRTHQDSWHDDKAAFSTEELAAIDEVLISPHYYA
ncbi:hypothetical protein ACHHYP_16784 [Achlya hypogyna]|uniref:Proteasome activator subunit 4 n=1 Tax=Achlya hypogyna TaxID=1202772 RepID=A0A1V9Y5T6_ACHHY|nr:hypothetical protein ACHHYP_16784 [Achlya hypogyna]